MAYTLEEIYLTRKEAYSMKLVAGVNGIRSTVSWVHMVETAELIPFLKRRELVITTGIRNNSMEDLREFVNRLKGKQIAGLIINIGPYIKEVPQDIIELCEKENLPLFTLPWEVRLVEFSHDVCRSIVLDESAEKDIEEAFLDGMMFPGRLEESRKLLSRHGFGMNTVFQMFVCMIADGMEDKYELVSEDLHDTVESILNHVNEHYILFEEKGRIFAVLADYNPGEVKMFARELQAIQLHYGYQCYCGVNPATSDFKQLAQYYERAGILLKLAKSRHMKLAYYENLETYKLLLSVSDMKVLEDYHGRTVGLLKQYDSMNKSHLFELLRQYFENDGKIQNLADKNYVHRNTIHYQLEKIEKILGISLDSWDDRIKIHLGLLIDEIL